MSFSEHKLSDVSYESQFPGCAIIKETTDEDQKIALTRGIKTKGMDLINLKTPTASREEGTSQLPMETYNEGLGFSQMVKFTARNSRV